MIRRIVLGQKQEASKIAASGEGYRALKKDILSRFKLDTREPKHKVVDLDNLSNGIKYK